MDSDEDGLTENQVGVVPIPQTVFSETIFLALASSGMAGWKFCQEKRDGMKWTYITKVQVHVMLESRL